MQDLTTGSITRHLLKTASFMLVTMVFQTLYFLVDLYWVGRLGKEAVAAVGIAGNLTFIVLAISQMLGVGHDDARVACRRPQGSRARAARVQSVAGAFGPGRRDLSRRLACCCAARTPLRSAPTPQTARQAEEYLTWFIPAMALQFAMVAMGAALRGTGNFKPGTIVATATVILNMVLAPFLIFGWGTACRLASRARRSRRSSRSRSASSGWRRYFMKPECVPALSCRRSGCRRFSALGSDAQDRPAGRRRVRADGRVPVRRLRDQPAVRRRRASRIRHRLADRAGGIHAGRRAGVLGRAGGGPELRRAAAATGCAKTFVTAAAMAAGVMALWAVALPLRRRRRWCDCSPPTRRSSTSAGSTCASSRGRSSDRAWCSCRRACSRRLATRCRRWPRRSGGCCSTALPAVLPRARRRIPAALGLVSLRRTIVFQVAAVLWLLQAGVSSASGLGEFRLATGCPLPASRRRFAVL